MKSFKCLLVLGAIFFTSLVFPNPVCALNTNPVVWKTNYAKLASSNFYIRIGNTYYYVKGKVTVKSDPGIDRTTLELTWSENNTFMGMNVYFKKTSNNEWELYDLRTGDGTGSGNWIYYSPKDSLGNMISSIPGLRNYAYERIFLSTSGQDAEIYCKECSIEAFIENPLKYSTYGYALEIPIGLEANETITVTTEPLTGYGVNAILKNKDGQVVKDQSEFTYEWQPQNANIVDIGLDSIEYADGRCAFEMYPPCPYINALISGLNPGVTTINVSVIRNDSNHTVVATNSFDVKVVSHLLNFMSGPTPTPSSPNLEKLEQDLEGLKGTVGEIKLENQQQSRQINALQKIIESIVNFFRRISWFNKR